MSTSVRVPRFPLYQLGAAPPADGWQRYTEIVRKVWGNGKYTIDLKPESASGLGFGTTVASVVRAPGAPLYQLGAVGLARRRHSLLGQAGPAAVASSSAITASLLPHLFPVAAAAGPLAPIALAAAGIAVLGSLIAGLWSKHDARVKGAKAENQAVNSALQTWDAGMQAIFAAANSSDPTQNVTGQQAAQMVAQLLQTYWQKMQPFMGVVGAADNSGAGANCGTYVPGVTTRCSPGHPCNKSCTAGCCVGCNDLWPSSLDAIALLQNPQGGTMQTCTVYGSKYGAQQRNGYTLTYTPPAIASGTAGIAAGSLSSVANTTGIPEIGLLVGAGLLFFLLMR